MTVLLPAAEPLSVTMTTHKFLPFHRPTTHSLLLARLYTRGVHLPENRPESPTLAMKLGGPIYPSSAPKDTPTIRMQKVMLPSKVDATLSDWRSAIMAT